MKLSNLSVFHEKNILTLDVVIPIMKSTIDCVKRIKKSEKLGITVDEEIYDLYQIEGVYRLISRTHDESHMVKTLILK